MLDTKHQTVLKKGPSERMIDLRSQPKATITNQNKVSMPIATQKQVGFTISSTD
jgi:hypothetical protein